MFNIGYTIYMYMKLIEKVTYKKTQHIGNADNLPI